MNLTLGAITQEFSGVSELAPKISILKDLTITAGRDVSRLAWNLRPTVLDDIGLQPAIEQLAEKWGESTPLSFELHLTLGPQRFSKCIETVLYRIAQEAVTNVVKHANATKVGIVLRADRKKATLIVEDDGPTLRGSVCSAFESASIWSEAPWK
jgi:signal transduction histidine kinase